MWEFKYMWEFCLKPPVGVSVVSGSFSSVWEFK